MLPNDLKITIDADPKADTNVSLPEEILKVVQQRITDLGNELMDILVQQFNREMGAEAQRIFSLIYARWKPGQEFTEELLNNIQGKYSITITRAHHV